MIDMHKQLAVLCINNHVCNSAWLLAVRSRVLCLDVPHGDSGSSVAYNSPVYVCMSVCIYIISMCVVDNPLCHEKVFVYTVCTFLHVKLVTANPLQIWTL